MTLLTPTDDPNTFELVARNLKMKARGNQKSNEVSQIKNSPHDTENHQKINLTSMEIEAWTGLGDQADCACHQGDLCGNAEWPRRGGGLFRTSSHRCVPTSVAVYHPDAGIQQVGGVDHADRVVHDWHVDHMVP